MTHWTCDSSIRALAAYVHSQNMLRRHLDKSQQATVTVKMADLVRQVEDEAKERRRKGQEKGRQTQKTIGKVVPRSPALNLRKNTKPPTTSPQ